MDKPNPQTADVPVAEYVQRNFVPVSRVAHDWQFHTAVPLPPAEDRMMVREPAAAVPGGIAQRIGALRVLVVPYVACAAENDLVAWTKPKGETHSAVWVEGAERVDLVLPCRELDAHDTGFEFLASVAELLRSRLNEDEAGKFDQLILEELRQGVSGEIDDDARAAKKLATESHSHRAKQDPLDAYLKICFVSTAAEYMHGLWHDVQVHIGAEHLPVRQLRQRMKFFAEMFPPNEGYSVFSKELEIDASGG